MTDPVTEPPGRDEAGRVDEGVPADDELERGVAGVQFALQHRQGDVDHEEVELRHERRDKDSGQCQPAPP